MLLIYLSMLESNEDQQEFIELYNRYCNTMLLVARRYFPQDQSSAEDAVQNAWIKAIENFSKIQEIPCNKKGAYLVIIVKHECISLLRNRKNELPLEEDLTVGQEDMDDSAKSVVEIICEMPDTYRSVLELRFVEGCNAREISKRLRLTESTVNTRIHRGRTLLIKKLKEEGYAT